MTSLTGSAGEDFASILRALGYRMERRAAPPPKPARWWSKPLRRKQVSRMAAPEPLGNSASEALVESTAAIAEAVPAVTARSRPISDVAPAAEHAASPPSAALRIGHRDRGRRRQSRWLRRSAGRIRRLRSKLQRWKRRRIRPPLNPRQKTLPLSMRQRRTRMLAAAAPDAIAAPEMVEVWRPGGRSEERRPRHDRNRHRHQERPAEGAAPAAAAGEAGEAAKRERHRRGRRDRNNDFRKPRTDAPVEAAPAAAPDAAPVREPREDKVHQPRERFQGKGGDSRTSRQG